MGKYSVGFNSGEGICAGMCTGFRGIDGAIKNTFSDVFGAVYLRKELFEWKLKNKTIYKKKISLIVASRGQQSICRLSHPGLGHVYCGGDSDWICHNDFICGHSRQSGWLESCILKHLPAIQFNDLGYYCSCKHIGSNRCLSQCSDEYAMTIH